ncbi:GntR family transcriptional regulator [Teredinibacter waterburyi]|jgi:Predicted transcriptional regulators|uniref:GntR family transcriptional regulator n=1 Tax=Teredinibacter waterburyi TaxID=1500538 RepID=UPI00165F7B4E|nr:GntR family transcriptional regulator [Teredinibacter waterburyi]
MKFDDAQAIYIQIADYITDQIVLGKWPENERIPSVRELAAELKVNVNTAMRSYGYLQDQEIIENKRGIGYFTASNAVASLKLLKRQRFAERDLPKVFKEAQLLGYSVEDLTGQYQLFLENNK